MTGLKMTGLRCSPASPFVWVMQQQASVHRGGGGDKGFLRRLSEGALELARACRRKMYSCKGAQQGSFPEGLLDSALRRALE